MSKSNIFDGEGYRPIAARIIYRMFKSRKWFSYADVVNDLLASAGKTMRYEVTKEDYYGEIKKAFMDVRRAIGEGGIESQGNNRCKKFRYTGTEDDPLEPLVNASAIRDIRRYAEFCQDSEGFMPAGWLSYYLKDSSDLLKIKKRRSRGAQIMSAGDDRQLRNIEMLPELYEAIKQHRALAVTYRPYAEDTQTLTFSPHFLKEYNGRWFLFGHAEGKEPSEGYNLALDRIVSAADATDDFIPAPEGFYAHLFDNIVGVTCNGGPAYDIHVRAYSRGMFGLTATKPLHSSQKTVTEYGQHDDGEYGEFVIHAELNNELIGRIMQMGSGLEVTAPHSVRHVFAKRARDLAARYGGD